MLFSVEFMFLEQIVVVICLMFVLAVNTLERVSAEFLFLCFKSQQVHFEISFVTPYHFSMIFQLMQTIIFLVL